VNYKKRSEKTYFLRIIFPKVSISDHGEFQQDLYTRNDWSPGLSDFENYNIWALLGHTKF